LARERSDDEAQAAPLIRAVEALLFSADRPLSLGLLQGLLGEDNERALRIALRALAVRYDGEHCGIALLEVAGGFQLRTAPDLAALVTSLREVRPMRLSRAALETLSIVAYRQPVTRAEITAMRGVDSAAPVKTLVEMDLLRPVGRRLDAPGRPKTFGTSPRFLHLFGLRSLDDMPTLTAADDLPPLLRVPDDDDAAADTSPSSSP
jgi:segregation and condensation protein B